MALSPPEKVAQFEAQPFPLHRIEWLDAQGRLVSPMIAVTLRLTKRLQPGVLTILIDADDHARFVRTPNGRKVPA